MRLIQLLRNTATPPNVRQQTPASIFTTSQATVARATGSILSVLDDITATRTLFPQRLNKLHFSLRPGKTMKTPRASTNLGVIRGANGIRTRDPHTASVMRYQLRHSPVLFSNGLQVTAQNWLPTNPLAAAIFYLIWLGHVVFSLISLPSIKTRGEDTWPSPSFSSFLALSSAIFLNSSA